MTEVEVVRTVDNTARTTTSDTYVKVDATAAQIDGSALQPTTNYLLRIRYFANNESSNRWTGVRVVTADDTGIAAKSEMIMEPIRSDPAEAKVVRWEHSFQTSATPTDVYLEFKTQQNTNAAQLDQSAIECINLDDIGPPNYVEKLEAATSADLSTTLTAEVAIAGSDLGTTKEWWIGGYIKAGVSSINSSVDVELRLAEDAASATVVNSLFEEGEDTDEFRVFGVVGRHKAVTSDVDVSIFAAAETATHFTFEGGYLIAIDTSIFEDFEWSYDNAGIDITSETTVVSTTHTPTVNGNHIIEGYLDHLSRGDLIMHLENGTTVVRTGDDLISGEQRWDATDIEAGYTMDYESISASTTYNLRALTDLNDAQHCWLIVVNMNLVSGGTDHTETVNDDVGVTDAVSRIHDAERTLNDPVGVTDDVSRVHDATRIFTDPIGVTDTVLPAKFIQIIVNEAIGVGDAVVTVKTITSIVNDAIGVADVISRTVDAQRTVNDPIGVADAVTPVKTITQLINDIIGVTDSVIDLKVIQQIVTDIMGITDDTIRALTIARIVTEVIGVGDDTPRVLDITRTATDDVGITDLVARVLDIARTVTDDIGVTDTIATDLTSGGTDHTETFTDAINVTDNASRVIDFKRTVNDPIALTDVILTAKHIRVTVTEAIGVTDAASAVKTTPVVVTDAIGLTDTVTRTVDAARVVNEPIGVTDSVSRIHDAVRTVNELIGVTDIISPAKTHPVTVTDTINVTDTAIDLKFVVIIPPAPDETRTEDPVRIFDDVERTYNSTNYRDLNQNERSIGGP